MNPILSMLNSQKNPNLQVSGNNSMQNNGNMLSNFATFKRSMEGKDPKAIVNELRASGQMSEQQYQTLLAKAKDLASFLS